MLRSTGYASVIRDAYQLGLRDFGGCQAPFNSFLNNHDLGPRLMNVAISRAKSRLFVIASRENLMNPVIAQIATIISETAAVSRAKPHSEPRPLGSVDAVSNAP